MGVKIVDTALRDGSQSLIATRLTTDEILQVAPLMDKAGYHACQDGTKKGNPEVCPVEHHHDADGTACGHCAVYCQICHIQNFICQVHPDCHHTPDKALGDGTGKCADK